MYARANKVGAVPMFNPVILSPLNIEDELKKWGGEYMSGENIKKDQKKGFVLIKEAAENGHGLAMRDLGRCYQFANGTPGNMKKAVEWYEKALEVIEDPELAQKTAMFKMMADADPDFGEDYPESEDDAKNIDLYTKNVEDTRQLYMSSGTTYLEVISAQANLLNAQISKVTDDFYKMQAVVSLYSALGGGTK